MKVQEYIDLMSALADMAKKEMEEVYGEDRGWDVGIGINIMKDKIINSKFLLEKLENE